MTHHTTLKGKLKMKQIKINDAVINDIIAMLSWLDQTPECAKMSIVDRMWEQVHEMWNDEIDLDVDEFEINQGKLIAIIDGEEFHVVGK